MNQNKSNIPSDVPIDRQLDELAALCDNREKSATFSKSTDEFTKDFFRANAARPATAAQTSRILAKAAAFVLVAGIITFLIATGLRANSTHMKEATPNNIATIAQADAEIEAVPVSEEVLAYNDAATFSKSAPAAAAMKTAEKPLLRTASDQLIGTAANNMKDDAAAGAAVTNLAAVVPADNGSSTAAAKPTVASASARGVSASVEPSISVIPDRRIVHPIVWPRPLPPIRVLPPDPQLEPVIVESGSAAVRVSGNLAQTTYEFVVSNPNGRALEGQFELPLPDKAAVTNVALDINDAMIDASIVPKDRAREVFDIVERQGVDPALVESVGGNTYRTRIYPVPAHGTRRIRIEFITQLVDIDTVPVLILPMRFENKLKSFSIRVEVDDISTRPSVETSQFANITFSNWRNALLAEQTITDVALPEDLRLSLARTPDLGKPVLEKSNGKTWLHLIMPYSPANDKKDIALDKIALVWDNSGSRANHDHAAELEQLKAVLPAGASVSLYFLNSKLDSAGTFTNTAALVKAISECHYDGGTNLAELAPVFEKNTPAVLVTDGIDNFGPGLDRKPAILSPLVVISSSSTSETALLDSLVSQAPSGAFLNLATRGVDKNVKPTELFARTQQGILPIITVDGYRFEGEISVSGDTLELVGPVADNAKKLVVGNNKFLDKDGREALVKLAYTPLMKEFDLDSSTALESSLVRTRYGQLLLASLQRTPTTTREQFIDLSREYRLVTPHTSMLVLDSIDQYIRYEIQPPASLPDFCRQYEEAMARKNKDKKDAKKDLASVMARYQREIIDWYEGKIKVTTPYRRGYDDVDDEVRPMGGFSGAVRRAAYAVTDGVARVANAAGFGVGGSARRESAPMTANGDVMIQEESLDMSIPMDMEEGRVMSKAAGGSSSAQPATKKITLKQWSSDADYLREMNKDDKKALDVYWKFRKDNAANAGFFVDCAQFFFDHEQKDLAIHILSNLAELQLENRFLLRILGYKLRYFGELTAAERVFRKVLELCPEEAQSYRDLALTLRDEKKWQEAADLFLYVIEHNFDGRFPNIDLIAVTELNHLVTLAKRDGAELKGIDPQLVHPIETDLRIIISWDTDLSDMDLHVTDPTGELCFYSHRYTVNGGRISNDFTQGYGPEEFMVREALNGKYKVQTHYYGQSAQTMIGPVTLYAEIITDYGRENESVEYMTFRLKSRDEMVDLGEVETSGSKKTPAEIRPILPPKPVFNEPHHGARETGAATLPSIDAMYQVRANESIEDIAEKFYHDRTKADTIRDANRDKLRDGSLPTGTLITVPGLSSADR